MSSLSETIGGNLYQKEAACFRQKAHAFLRESNLSKGLENYRNSLQFSSFFISSLSSELEMSNLQEGGKTMLTNCIDSNSQDWISRSLNLHLENLNFSFFQNDIESSLIVNNQTPVYFNNDAGGSCGGGSKAWLEKKHRAGQVHEPATIAVIQFLQKYFSKRIKVLFEIGTAYGYFTLILKATFPKATVFGFESNPDTYQAFQKNVATNKHLPDPSIKCLNIGLSDTTSLKKDVTIRGMHLQETTEGKTNHTIDILSLDDFCRISGFQPDFIKIDVEGYQSKILPGGMSILKSSKPIIIFEFDTPKTIKKFNTTNKQVIKPLFDLGYKMYWCKNHRRFDGKFRQMNFKDLSQEQERNSLAVFIPT